MAFCRECKNKKAISPTHFNHLPFEFQRRLDCKTILSTGSQCMRYSIENAPEEDRVEIRKLIREGDKIETTTRVPK